MNIYPVDREWLHIHVLEAHLQGVQLIKQAWHGINFHSFKKSTLSMQERGTSFLTGIVLMIPLISNVIWVFWKTFGNPKLLFDPYYPEVEENPAHLIKTVAKPVQKKEGTPHIEAVDDSQKKEIEPGFIYRENQDEVIWKIKNKDQKITVQVRAPEYNSDSLYDEKWKVLEYRYQKGDLQFGAIFLDENQISVSVNKSEPVILVKGKPLPWIQQPTLGFKDFILSDKKEMEFYTVLPVNPVSSFLAKPPLLMEAKARKVGIEEFPGIGKVVKIEIQSAWGFPYHLLKGTIWYDAPDGKYPGILRKFIDPGIIAPRTGILAQNNLSP